MYLLSPASTRFAFGPGSAVMILGPIRVWVDMTSSEVVVGRSSLVVGFRRTLAWSRKRKRTREDGRVSRYRINWDASAMATLPDNGEDTPESGSSKRADANWDLGGPSGNIPSLV